MVLTIPHCSHIDSAPFIYDFSDDFTTGSVTLELVSPYITDTGNVIPTLCSGVYINTSKLVVSQGPVFGQVITVYIHSCAIVS